MVTFTCNWLHCAVNSNVSHCLSQISSSIIHYSLDTRIYKKDIQFNLGLSDAKKNNFWDPSLDFVGPLLIFLPKWLGWPCLNFQEPWEVESQFASYFAIYFAQQTVWSPTNQKLKIYTDKAQIMWLHNKFGKLGPIRLKQVFWEKLTSFWICSASWSNSGPILLIEITY